MWSVKSKECEQIDATTRWSLPVGRCSKVEFSMIAEDCYYVGMECKWEMVVNVSSNGNNDTIWLWNTQIIVNVSSWTLEMTKF